MTRDSMIVLGLVVLVVALSVVLFRPFDTQVCYSTLGEPQTECFPADANRYADL